MIGFPLNGFGVIVLKKKYSKVRVRIFLTETPNKHNVGGVNHFLHLNNITAVFCFTEQQYDANNIHATVYRFEIKDGSPPNRTNSTLLTDFTHTFNSLYESLDAIATKTVDGQELQLNLLFHCDSGYGRAPTMIAYTMISYFHMNGVESINQIRKVRKGSINAKQLQWLMDISDSKKKTCCIL